MHPRRLRRAALAHLEAGATVSATARHFGLDRSTVRNWRDRPVPSGSPSPCPLCDDAELDGAAYAALLGYYLGDGSISRAARFYALRVTCDARYSGVIDDVADRIRSVRPGTKVFFVAKTGAIDVQAHWKHWPCLFPQHGPGRKHERPIVLEPWQRDVVERHPAAFLRGLFHSDGARSKNWTTRVVAGERKRYDYPRWQFANHSDDIRGLCCWALDLVGVAWRQSSWKTVSVSRRDAVARLDALIGLKQ